MDPQGPGKKWEHMEVNSNGKPVRISMHVRKGDTVQVCVRALRAALVRTVQLAKATGAAGAATPQGGCASHPRSSAHLHTHTHTRTLSGARR